MTKKEALRIVGRQSPCPHDTVNTALGDGKTWVRCDDCNATLLQANLADARSRALEFEVAMALIDAELDDDCPKPPDPLKYISVEALRGMTVSQLCDLVKP